MAGPGQAEVWIKADVDSAMAMPVASEPPAMEANRGNRAVNTPRYNREDLLSPLA